MRAGAHLKQSVHRSTDRRRPRVSNNIDDIRIGSEYVPYDCAVRQSKHVEVWLSIIDGTAARSAGSRKRADLTVQD